MGELGGGKSCREGKGIERKPGRGRRRRSTGGRRSREDGCRGWSSTEREGMVELEELQWRFVDGKVGPSPERRRLGKNGEVEEFAGKIWKGKIWRFMEGLCGRGGR